MFNPRKDATISKMVCFSNRYILGDKHNYKQDDYNSWQELKEDIIRKEYPYVILPLYLYDHSGITISTRPFSCEWDSGQVGFIYTTKEILKENGIDNILNLDEIKDLLREETLDYDSYLRGDEN